MNKVLFFIISLCWSHMICPVFELDRAIHAYRTGKPEQARERLEHMLTDEPKNQHVLYNLGKCAYAQQDYQAAARYFDKAANVPTPIDQQLTMQALFDAGNAYVQKQQLQEALQRFEAVLKLRPKHEQAQRMVEQIKKKLEEQQQHQENKQDQKNDEQKDNDQQQDKQQQNDQQQNQDQKNQQQSDQEQQKDDKGKSGQDKQSSDNQKQSSGQQKKDQNTSQDKQDQSDQDKREQNNRQSDKQQKKDSGNAQQKQPEISDQQNANDKKQSPMNSAADQEQEDADQKALQQAAGAQAKQGECNKQEHPVLAWINDYEQKGLKALLQAHVKQEMSGQHGHKNW